MLTKEEIREIQPINKEAVEFFLDLAEKRMRDELENKKELENKAYIIFAGYIAAISALVLVMQFTDPIRDVSCVGLSIAILIFGQLCILISLRTAYYGVLGAEPSTWLEDEHYIKLEEWNDMGLLKAYVLHSYESQINKSVESNAIKSNLFNLSVYAGCVSTIPLFIFVFI